MALSNRFVGTGSLMSASCGLADLVEDGQPISASAGEALDTGAGWVDRWTTAWKVSGGKVVCPVRDLALFPISGCEPVRRFSWRRGQHHRPGLQFMVSTGQHHGFESLEEARLLLALACGWRYLLVTGWRRHAMATLDTFSSQRRLMGDPLGLRELLLGRAARGGMSFGEIAAGTLADPVARAQALHLLWSRRLSVDLTQPLTDATVVSLAWAARP